MTKLIVSCAVFGLFVCTATNVWGQDKGKADPWSELTGKWVCESGWVQGKAMPKEVTSKMQLVLTRGRFVAQTMVGEQKGTLAFAGDPSQRRLKISTTVKGADGNPVTSTMNCMYKLDKGMLVIVYSVDEKFPTKFESTEKNQYLLVNYRKVAGKKTDSKKR